MPIQSKLILSPVTCPSRQERIVGGQKLFVTGSRIEIHIARIEFPLFQPRLASIACIDNSNATSLCIQELQIQRVPARLQ
jgi:hypothetical protein